MINFTLSLTRLVILLVVIVQSFFIQTQANTIQKLIEDEVLTVDSFIKELKSGEDNTLIPQQPITLVVEVSTNRWFARGVRLPSLNFDDFIIPGNDQLSINNSFQKNGETWTSLRKEVVLYPVNAGSFTIPAFPITISVNTESYGVVEGEMNTSPLDITISLPNQLLGIDNFVVTDQYTIDTQFDQDLETTFSIGDAITQTITITANNIPAMMIPSSSLTKTIEGVDGLSVYVKPPQVNDKSNRGVRNATRIETYTYIFEKSGEYSIPEVNYYWYDLSSGTLNKETIESQTFKVSSHIKSQGSEFLNLEVLFSQNILKLVGFLVVLISLATIIGKYKPALAQFYAKVSKQELRRAKQNYLTAFKNNNYQLSIDCLYQFWQIKGITNTLSNIYKSSEENAVLLKLKKQAFSVERNNNELTIREAKKLIDYKIPNTFENKEFGSKNIKLNS